ncbi:hypothetical protein GZL_08826 [Streptomyces sp. 769]|nr:hypothetical protein GZL_08826 [Streptomyces sp. 769]
MLVEHRDLPFTTAEVRYDGRQLGDARVAWAPQVVADIRGDVGRRPAWPRARCHGRRRGSRGLRTPSVARHAVVTAPEDRQVRLAERWARIDAQLLLQMAAGPVVVVEGLGLPTGCLQGPHQQRGQLLVQRMLRDPSGELRDQFPGVGRATAAVRPVPAARPAVPATGRRPVSAAPARWARPPAPRPATGPGPGAAARRRPRVRLTGRRRPGTGSGVRPPSLDRRARRNPAPEWRFRHGPPTGAAAGAHGCGPRLAPGPADPRPMPGRSAGSPGPPD